MSDNGRPIIQVQNVIKNYPVGDSEVEVLKGISFDVPTGQFLAIVGSSGNGKSTLLNMVAGIDQPTSGKVVVAGQTLNDMSENQLAAWRGPNLGIVFQFFQLLPSLSLLQNVIMPMDFTGRLTKKQRRSLGVSSNEPPLPAPWPMTRLSSSPMSPPATWTTRLPRSCSRSSTNCRRKAKRWSWSPIVRPWPGAPVE
jgi:ABC-type sugar transport system ATPase subunit